MGNNCIFLYYSLDSSVWGLDCLIMGGNVSGSSMVNMMKKVLCVVFFLVFVNVSCIMGYLR